MTYGQARGLRDDILERKHRLPIELGVELRTKKLRDETMSFESMRIILRVKDIIGRYEGENKLNIKFPTEPMCGVSAAAWKHGRPIPEPRSQKLAVSFSSHLKKR